VELTVYTSFEMDEMGREERYLDGEKLRFKEDLWVVMTTLGRR